MLVNVSYRDSKREDTELADFASNQAATTGSGSDTRQKIGTADGSWVINNRSFATAKYTDFSLRTDGRPGQRRQRHHQHDAGHAARHREPRQARSA